MATRYYHRRWADKRRIDVMDARDTAFWCKFFGIEEEDLLDAVDKVGTAAEDVRRYVHHRLEKGWTVYAGREERRQGLPGG